MVDFDLDRLGDVWRQQPDPEEMERLQRTAIAVARRARLSQVIDLAAALVVAAVVIALVIANPRGPSVLMGVAAILFMLYNTYSQRKLRQVLLQELTGSTENMLQQSVERVETTLRRNRLTLILIGPAVLTGILFAAVAVGQRSISDFAALHDLPLLRPLFQAASFAGLAAFVVYMLLAARRCRRELDRLKAMSDSYREERESTSD
jgi:hypothetical protein